MPTATSSAVSLARLNLPNVAAVAVATLIVGRNVTAPLALPAGYVGQIAMRVARNMPIAPLTWSTGSQSADLSIEASPDGATWQTLALSPGEVGGMQADPSGVNMPYSWLLAYASGAQWAMVRGVVNVTAGIFTSSVEIFLL